MKLGLIGLGKQGQRYLQEKNGGRHIVRSGSRSIDLDGLDGVIIATHPAGHKQLALECIERGLPVLVEKPLALTLADCEAIVGAAERAMVRLEVAHTHLWSEGWGPPGRANFVGSAQIQYVDHERDYSPWLDWAPHALALLASRLIEYSPAGLAKAVEVKQGPKRAIDVAVGAGPSRYHYHGDCSGEHTPMWHMLEDFTAGKTHGYEFQRRVYRALFSEEHHG